MSAFIIVEVKIKNHKEYEGYKKLVPSTLEKYGGKFIVRGGKTESLEGNWNPERFVILQFESMEKAKAWWSSEEYSRAKKIRYKNAESKMLLAEGM
ncbi:MAG TPA: DUF1330 domain-containing protein [Ignavibacteriaceae bacterium]|nr:DUF1330 domain-containing protein [Ignavibacteriaceae bacterium]